MNVVISRGGGCRGEDRSQSVTFLVSGSISKGLSVNQEGDPSLRC